MRITPGEMRASAGLAAAPPGYTKESPLETRFRAVPRRASAVTLSSNPQSCFMCGTGQSTTSGILGLSKRAPPEGSDPSTPECPASRLRGAHTQPRTHVPIPRK